MIIRTKAFPRAAVIGNPSDGYFGKTIAFVFSNHFASIELYESPNLKIIPGRLDRMEFDSVPELIEDVERFGYYGGNRLIKATIKRFFSYCAEKQISLDTRNFTISYHSNIPVRLGLAGSSAIIIATLKALMQFYDVEIEKPKLANVALSVENDELGISGGLQDRVAQVYETPVFMDFNEKHFEEQGCGVYNPTSLPEGLKFYIAFRENLAEGSETVHNDLAERFANREKEVLIAMAQWSQLTDDFLAALESANRARIHELINRNFDIRQSIMDVDPGQIELIEFAREAGMSAKFTGSGGAVIGTFNTDDELMKLRSKMEKIGATVILPEIVNTSLNGH